MCYVMKYQLEKESSKRVEIIDITSDINNILGGCKINEGIVNIFAVHSTAGIVINENEPGLINDFQKSLERIAPENNSYEHNNIDNNADSHIRAFYIGGSETVPFSRDSLSLGTWQSVFFVELDGPRNRKFIVTVTGK
ncbi:MAG: secondary thiamine-phosphate synthase enzyme YjbQ [Methanobacterium sp.]